MYIFCEMPSAFYSIGASSDLNESVDPFNANPCIRKSTLNAFRTVRGSQKRSQSKVLTYGSAEWPREVFKNSFCIS